MEPSLTNAAKVVTDALAEVAQGLVEREALIETIALAAVAEEHLLIIGPPGTAKSEAVRRFARALEGRYFEYLLGRFTEPSELFGPIDLRKLRDGVVATEVSGMLPEAQVVFLDEVFQGSTAILNTLLGVLNERVFRRGHTILQCPLRVCVGASNGLPSDESLAAFADRFLLRAFVTPIGESRIEELLEGGARLQAQAAMEPGSQASIDALDVLTQAARSAPLEGVRSAIADGVRLLRKAGVDLSDRRIVKLQKLVAAAAALAGRATPDLRDLWPMVAAVPSAEGQAVARDVLRDFLGNSENAALVAAAEAASAGPKARATRLCRSLEAVLGDRPERPDALGAWRGKLEALAREIDASFAPTQLSAELADGRSRLLAALAADADLGDGVGDVFPTDDHG